MGRVLQRTMRQGAVIVVSTFAMASCATSGSSDESSCERRIEFNGQVYTDYAPVALDAGIEIGQATFLPCADRSAEDEAAPVTVFAIAGLDTSEAIGVGSAAADAELFVVKTESGEAPASVTEYLENGEGP